jgi:hypothetical protein
LIYFIQAGPFVKIGYTGNIKARQNELRVGCPYEQKLLRTIPGGLKMEAMIHSMAARYHFRGEWFRYEGELKKWVEGADNTESAIFDDGFVTYHFTAENDPKAEAALADYMTSIGKEPPRFETGPGVPIA